MITGRQYEIADGEHRVTVSEVGATLRGYRVGERDVTVTHPADALPPKSNGAVLMPWPNRIRDGRYRFAGQDLQLALTEPANRNASHGLANWARWSVADRGATHLTLICDVVAQRGWPFELRTSVSYRVDAASGLHVRLGAENIGSARLPFGAGSHPYLALGRTALEDVELRVPATHYVLTDERQIPIDTVPVEGTDYDFRAPRRVGDLRLDTAFAGLPRHGGRESVELRAGDRVSRLWWDASTFTTVQVFTLPALVDGPAVAVEPMTCAANAFNTGADLIVLEPGGRWSAEWGIDAG